MSRLTIGPSTLGPERLEGLQFGTVGRQLDEPEAVGHVDVGASSEAGIVEQKHDAFLGPGFDRGREGCEQAGGQRSAGR